MRKWILLVGLTALSIASLYNVLFVSASVWAAPPATVTVWRYVDGGSGDWVTRSNLQLESWVNGTVPNEWYSSWGAPSLRSGAVASRSWVSYRVNAGAKVYDQDYGANYRDLDWPYGSTNENQYTRDTIFPVQGTYMTYADADVNAQFRGAALRGHWTDHWSTPLYSVGDPVSAVTYNPWTQGFPPTYPNASCPSSSVGCPGESQMGSHQWELGPYAWNEWQILSHYYSAVNFAGGGFGTGLRWVDQTTKLPQNCNSCTPYYDENTYPTVNDVPGGYVFNTYTPVMRLQNTGTIDYCNTGSNPIRLGYHWEGPKGVFDNGDRINVGNPPSFYGDPSGCLSPGRYSPLSTPFKVQGVMGIYTLKWDMVREYDRWFSTDGWPTKNIEFNVYDGFDYAWNSRDADEWNDVVSTGGTIDTSGSNLVTTLTVANSQPVYARQTLTSFDTGRNLEIQANFYDDGNNPKGAVFGAWSNDTIFRLAAGVASWVTTQNYSYRVNDNWYDSGKPRAVGWHTLKMHIRPTGAWVDIDGQNPSPTTGALTPATIWKIGPLMHWNQAPATARWDSIGYRYVP